ncbi:MAG: DUF4397 domain-containing protein [Bacteroidota bacterium]
MKRVLFLSFGLLLLLSSCVKKKDVPVGEVKVRFINAVTGSGSQDVFANNTLETKLGIGYAQATDYLTFYSGINLFAFADRGSTTANAIISYGLETGDHASVYYYKTLAGALAAGGIKDDMTAPPTGKARVRFVHLNNFLNNSLKVSVVGGADLFPALVFAAASSYYNVDPGTKFQPSATGVTVAPEIATSFQAGKIYTVILTGSVNTELYAFSVLQN